MVPRVKRTSHTTEDTVPLVGGSGDEAELCEEAQTSQSEPMLIMAVQIFIPFLIAGFGMVGAGMVLDNVQHWQVFVDVPEVFILVPALLGLKGNLEMTLASRISTQANLGTLDSTQKRHQLVIGNLALIQAQAITVGLLAACVAVVGNWVKGGQWDMPHAALLCASSTFTASIASLVLASLMIGVIFLSRWMGVNPDNVATPIAAALGDLVTLSILAGVATGFYKFVEFEMWWICVLLTVLLAVLIPWSSSIAHHNPYTAEALMDGWTPVIAAMAISSVGGFILQLTVSVFKGIAVFQPVINGVGGNLAAVLASRLSTNLHTEQTPRSAVHPTCPNPFKLLFGSKPESSIFRLLFLMVAPGHVTFISTIHFLSGGHTSLTIKFACFYLLAATLQVVILLCVTIWLVKFAWHHGSDPDNCSIPYVTALGDMLGTGLLALCFVALYVTGDKDLDLGD